MDAIDPSDLEAIEAARTFRKRSRPLAIAVTANVLLASVCLGVPYYRGRAQAKASMHAFARFTGCLFGAQAGRGLGLGLPPGERDHFAAQVLGAPLSWP